MANFPGSLDSLTNPTPSDPQNSPSHSGQHATANDILEAVEAKVGTGASTSTSGTVLTGTGVGTSAWQAPTLFNGGTITDPLTIDSDSDSDSALHVIAGSALTVGVEVTVNPATGLEVAGLDNYGNIRVSDDFSGGFTGISSGSIACRGNGGQIGRSEVDGTKVVALGSLGLRLNTHATPADGDLQDGEAIVWFDDTDGAAKLMIKAKSADGTVVTGSVNLT